MGSGNEIGFVHPSPFGLGSRFVLLQESVAYSAASFTNQLMECLRQRYLIGSCYIFLGGGREEATRVVGIELGIFRTVCRPQNNY